MSGRQLRIVPYNGNRAYKYYLDGYKVNGKRKRLFFKERGRGQSQTRGACQAAEKECQDGLDIPLDPKWLIIHHGALKHWGWLATAIMGLTAFGMLGTSGK